jgi:hypothetical protein
VASYSSKNVAARIRARESWREYVQWLLTAVETAHERVTMLDMMYRALQREDAMVEGGGGGGYGQQDMSGVEEGATARKQDDWEWREGLGEDEDIIEGEDCEGDEVDVGLDGVKKEGEDDAGQPPRAKYLGRGRD